MTTVTFLGNATNLVSNAPEVGTKAPAFELCQKDLNSFTNKDCEGNVTILSIVPSLDTGVCAASARRFNKEATALGGVKVLCISKDLPFAMDRFCSAEGIENVVPLSDFRNDLDFGKSYGVGIVDGPLRGLLTRAIFIIDKKGDIAYKEIVPEITESVNFEEALKVAKSLI